MMHFTLMSNTIRLPELATTEVAGGEGGVGEGEWFGGAAINDKVYIVQAC